ncbi:PEP-CTERM sorting domain-containing protein [Duganella sp. FT3S]|uniref:PEP-CTERM sorting domain-containing protein n=1 Tax=Rugamonas fusca TaxID=2758568 RepID=A0A7W2EJD3_9BURK|nr:lectin-like protein [Rugamonas fusca]MBA5606929.1 PEP-CTERM sorting domain-containing protein [Rugamonas fusca]
MFILKQFARSPLLLAAASAQAVTPTGVTGDFGGHHYIELSASSWTDAEAAAVAMGAHLVAVNSQAENDLLISTCGSSHALWLGFHRTGPNSTDFAWSNGDAVTYTNGAIGEPNKLFGEQYAHTYANGKWNDVSGNSIWPGPKYGVVEAVPEPGRYAMLAAGLALRGWTARRKGRPR